MKSRKKRNLGEVDYWQPTSDMLISLLLILTLVISLLGLYILYIPDQILGDPWPGDADSEAVHEGYDEEDVGFRDDDGNADNDAAPTPEPTPTPTPTPTPYPAAGGGNGDGDGDYDEPDEGVKSAVYVMLVDADTDRTVKESGVVFELYSDDNGLQILNTYYPLKVAYREYETTESGTFYLPEKIYPGSYYLHELTEATGYEIAENAAFEIDELYDWSDPYTVRVPVYPSHNIIRIRVADKDTGLPVAGASFDVVAAEDILTLDGTLRYSSGQVVGEIVCDEDGYGESGELYLGRYAVRQKDIPEYYAGLLTTLSYTLEKKTDAESPVRTVESEKTTISLTLTDELYEDKPIAGAEFELRRGAGETETLVTDSGGRITLTDLDKSVTYRLTQISSAEDYRFDTGEYTVTIGANGRVGTDAHPELMLTNRLIRVTISIEDALIGTQIDGENVAMYNARDELVHTWTSTGVATTFTDLNVGNYYVIRNGDKEHRYILRVDDTAEPQSLSVSLFTWRSAGAASLAAVIGGGLIIGGAVIIRRAARKRKEKKLARAAISEEGPTT